MPWLTPGAQAYERSLSVTISSLRISRSADRLSRRRWTSMSRTLPSWLRLATRRHISHLSHFRGPAQYSFPRQCRSKQRRKLRTWLGHRVDSDQTVSGNGSSTVHLRRIGVSTYRVVVCFG